MFTLLHIVVEQVGVVGDFGVILERGAEPLVRFQQGVQWHEAARALRALHRASDRLLRVHGDAEQAHVVARVLQCLKLGLAFLRIAERAVEHDVVATRKPITVA